MNLEIYKTAINKHLQPIRESTQDVSDISALQIKRIRKNIKKVHTNATREINRRSSQDARYRVFLRDSERVTLLNKMDKLIEKAFNEIDYFESNM